MATELRMFIAATEQEAKVEAGILERDGWRFIRRSMHVAEVTAAVSGNSSGAIAERNVWVFLAERDS